MPIARRELLAGAAASAAFHFLTPAEAQGATKMYGLIAKLVSIPNRRMDLISILKESTAQMPGCLAYVIAEDAAEENTLWITEFWKSQADHEASLTLPSVKDSIGKARPLMANFSSIA